MVPYGSMSSPSSTIFSGCSVACLPKSTTREIPRPPNPTASPRWKKWPALKVAATPRPPPCLPPAPPRRHQDASRNLAGRLQGTYVYLTQPNPLAPLKLNNKQHHVTLVQSAFFWERDSQKLSNRMFVQICVSVKNKHEFANENLASQAARSLHLETAATEQAMGSRSPHLLHPKPGHLEAQTKPKPKLDPEQYCLCQASTAKPRPA